MKKLRTLLVWVLLVLVVWAGYTLLTPSTAEHFYAIGSHEQFQRDLDDDLVAELRIDGTESYVTLVEGGGQYQLSEVPSTEALATLYERGVPVKVGPPPPPPKSSLSRWMWPLLLVLALLVAVLFFFRKMQRSSSSIMSMSKSKARLASEESKNLFSDVGGLEEAKRELADVVDFLQHPKRWENSGVRLPKGVLLEGPPGSGKTLLARAVAGEAKVPLFVVSASEFVEMFVGVGAARVRDMFDSATKKAPCLIFIDELDAVGRRRGSGIGSAHDEREQTLNQLLVSLDGFESNEAIVVIAATNRPDVLDRALLRAGRFDRIIRVPNLDRSSRLETLKIHCKKKPLGDDISLETIADRTKGMTGADLENLTNEAGLLAIRRLRGTDEEKPTIQMSDFDAVLDKQKTRDDRFNKLDALLIESANQLSQPTGEIHLALTMRDGTTVEGELVWADGIFIKIRRAGESDFIVPKKEIARIEAKEGTEDAVLSDIQAASFSVEPELA